MGTAINLSITGNVGNEPQVKTAANGQQVTSFSLAVNRKNKEGKQTTIWFGINCWNKLSDVANQYLPKGSLVQVNAELVAPKCLC